MTVSFATPGLRILPADISLTPTGRGAGRSSKSFGQQLQDAVSGVDRQGQEAAFKVASMLQGGGADVHDAMISVQKADLSFQLMLQVRNKVVQAYQEIERMQF
jgi:flagellar hook-basal body complex protein FliE